MINLTANQTEDAGLLRRDACLSLFTPPARNACQAVVSEDGFQSADDVASTSGSASKNALVSLRTNVHQNVHQRIKKDRIGYVRIRPNVSCKYLHISLLHSDSDPLPRIPVDLIGYGRIISDCHLDTLVRSLGHVFTRRLPLKGLGFSCLVDLGSAKEERCAARTLNSCE